MYRRNVVGRLLIDIVVHPVIIKKVRVRAPGHQRWQIGIVVLVVIARQVHISTYAAITLILMVKRVGCILQMTGNEKLATSTSHHDADTTVRRLGDKAKLRMLEDVVATYLCVTAVRHHKHIVETAEDGQSFLQCILREDAAFTCWIS